MIGHSQTSVQSPDACAAPAFPRRRNRSPVSGPCVNSARSVQNGLRPSGRVVALCAALHSRGASMRLSGKWLLVPLLAWAFAATGPAVAQTYPSRPISIVVPYPAGGVTDTLVRLVAERMRDKLGQP